MVTLKQNFILKIFDVLRTHWMEIMKKNRDSWCPASWLTVFQVSEKKEVPWREEVLNLFLKEKKFSVLKLESHKLLKPRWLDEVFIETTMKVIILLIVDSIEKLLWQFRHTGMSNKDNEHFYKQRPLKLFKCKYHWNSILVWLLNKEWIFETHQVA